MTARPDIILALDVGRKKTGVAVGNRITGGARPLTIVRGDTAQQLSAVARCIEEWQPGMIIVGLPMHMDGKAHGMTDRARRFATALEKQHALPVQFADERRSSMMARQRCMHEQPGELAQHHRQHPNSDIDDHAAAIILQNWLDAPQSGDIIAT